MLLDDYDLKIKATDGFLEAEVRLLNYFKFY